MCQNGAAGINFEHSVIDGHSVLRFASDVFTDTILTFAENIRKGNARLAHHVPQFAGEGPLLSVRTYSSSRGRETERGCHGCASAGFQASKSTGPKSSGAGANAPGLPGEDRGHKGAFKRIVWDISTYMKNAIRKAEAKISDMIPRVNLHVLDFSGYGKNFIVEQKMSPDAFIQVAFQVAYHRLYRECVTTYETLMTKRFFHGRTEAGFSVSKESMALAENFDSAPKEERVAAIRKAVDAHVSMVKVGADGRGKSPV